MELKELEELVDTVYGIVGVQYLDNFKDIIGGCHCFPATEWYGGIYFAFQKVLNDDVINDKYIKKQMIGVVKHFSKWLNK
ncbi:hypothetical protein [Clostridium omnivorum]|uniref:Uncharacterized protein n=1 Tax=Clostridium omnivorum TaxID=1604902 RepID=A0ABQ5N5Y3_9CLOT|nr:hypothetical protein [Clostridium sp. E14]GLC30613.1 hypothetical protein bsdE14_20230 [Clostridium sp. E14]